MPRSSAKPLPAPSGPPDGPLDRRIGAAIRETYRALSRAMQARTQQHGVAVSTWFMLRALAAENGLAQGELGRRCGVNAPAAVTTLARMEREGLVRRVRHPGDGRKINVFLTPRGRALKRRLVPQSSAVVAAALVGFSAEERARFLDMLERARRNLEPEPRAGRGRARAADNPSTAGDDVR